MPRRVSDRWMTLEKGAWGGSSVTLSTFCSAQRGLAHYVRVTLDDVFFVVEQAGHPVEEDDRLNGLRVGAALEQMVWGV